MSANKKGCSIWIYAFVLFSMFMASVYVQSLYDDHINDLENECYSHGSHTMYGVTYKAYWDRVDHECHMFTQEQIDSAETRIALDSILDAPASNK